MLSNIKKWLQRRKTARMVFYERTEYSFDGVTIRARDPLHADQSILIADISDIGIETNCLGPFVEDVFWLIDREGAALRIPQCSPVFNKIMEHYKNSKQFDWDQFTRSMSSTADAYFPCWSQNK
jgi:hypothetical protein